MPGVAFDCLRCLSWQSSSSPRRNWTLPHFSLFNLGTWYAMRVTNTTTTISTACPTQRRDPFNDNNDDDVIITRISDAQHCSRTQTCKYLYFHNYSRLIKLTEIGVGRTTRQHFDFSSNQNPMMNKKYLFTHRSALPSIYTRVTVLVQSLQWPDRTDDRGCNDRATVHLSILGEHLMSILMTRRAAASPDPA